MFGNCWKYLHCLVNIRKTRTTNSSFSWECSPGDGMNVEFSKSMMFLIVSFSLKWQLIIPLGWASELILCPCHMSKLMASESNPNCHHLSQNHKDVIFQSGCSGIPLLLPLVLMLLINLRNQAQDYWYLKTSNNLIFIMGHLSQTVKLQQQKKILFFWSLELGILKQLNTC